MLCAMIALKRSGERLSGDVLFVGVIDEELRSAGTIRLIESGLKADAAIVGEPSDGKVCVAHRGLEWYEFIFEGKTVHGGRQDEGINAIFKAARFVRAIEKTLAKKLRARTHPLLGGATVNVGAIEGGTQPSTVAGECRVRLDRRFLPTERYADMEYEFLALLRKMEKRDPEFKCRMQVMESSAMKQGYLHMPLETSESEDIVMTMREQLSHARGESAEIGFFPAWTDGGLLSYYGKIPTVVYGPGFIECCHSATEYISIDQLVEGCKAYALCAAVFCA
jgi:acetylornithine deacetylase/succinyl-diaminopimelate desuccinylase